jgi:AsmA protein
MRIVKILFISLLVIVILLVAGVASLPFLVDPNDHKDKIAAVVKKQTGRDLSINDTIKLSVFPWLALELGEVRLSNAAGFEQADFLKVGQIKASLKIKPLLHKKIEMQTIYLQGAEIYLSRDKDGRGNWEDLMHPKAGANDPQQPPGDGDGTQALALNIGGLEIKDAQIHWHDQSTGEQISLNNVNLTSGALALNAPLDIALAFVAEGKGKQIFKADVALEGNVHPNLDSQIHRINTLDLKLNAQAPMLPKPQALTLKLTDLNFDATQGDLSIADLLLNVAGLPLQVSDAKANINGSGSARLSVAAFNPREVLANLGHSLPPLPEDNMLSSAQFSMDVTGSLSNVALDNIALQVDDNSLSIPALRFDVAQQTLNIDKLELKALGVLLHAKVQGTDMMSQAKLDTTLNIAPFNPQPLLQRFQIKLPPPSDPQTLQYVGLKTKLSTDFSNLSLTDLHLQLDQTQANGHVQVLNLNKPALRFQLAVNEINLDRYLPPAAKSADTKPQEPAEDTPLPIDMLRDLDIDGNLKIGHVQAANVKMDNIVLTLKAKDGQVSIKPSADLYGGRFDNHVNINATSQPPRMQVKKSFHNIQAGALLDDLQNGQGQISGNANITVDLSIADASSLQTMQRSMNGPVNFDFRNGAYKGFNLGAKLRQAQAMLKGQTPPPSDETAQTDFSELSGQVKLADGVANILDLTVKAPLLRVSGTGSVGILDKALDVRLETSVVGTTTGQGGKELEQLRGLTLPVTVKGNAMQPQVGIDAKAMASALAKKEGSKLVEKNSEKIQKAVEEKLGKEAGGQAVDLLKGLFK